MLLHVKRTRVQREAPVSKPRYLKLGLGKNRSHEATYREGGDLNSDLGNDKRLRTVGKELVEEGKKST